MRARPALQSAQLGTVLYDFDITMIRRPAASTLDFSLRQLDYRRRSGRVQCTWTLALEYL